MELVNSVQGITLRGMEAVGVEVEVEIAGGLFSVSIVGLPDAAVREFHEEVGADNVRPEILGSLSPIYVHVSNFRVEPFVAVCRERPEFVANPAEVDEILEIPLEHLLDPANLSSHQRSLNGCTYTVPHFAWKSHRIWGATCLILGELVTVIDEITSQQA